jgi:hypothetical protein
VLLTSLHAKSALLVTIVCPVRKQRRFGKAHGARIQPLTLPAFVFWNPAQSVEFVTNSLRIYKFKKYKIDSSHSIKLKHQKPTTDYNEVIKHMPKLKSSITRRSNTAAVTDIAGVHPKMHDYMYK